ncbi:MAG TPA: hypothetical protein VK891_15600, partial [Euzebyales bacterium]|nr:hypothetical protein [Euzebyales bacterium]
IEFGLVLATEPVADDAYQYLADRVARNQGPMVSVLEGSQAIQDELDEAINEWSIISVRMLGEELINTTGVDFGAIIEEWMRRQTAEVTADDNHDRHEPGDYRQHDYAAHTSVEPEHDYRGHHDEPEFDGHDGHGGDDEGEHHDDDDIVDAEVIDDGDGIEDTGEVPHHVTIGVNNNATITELPRAAGGGQSA